MKIDADVKRARQFKPDRKLERFVRQLLDRHRVNSPPVPVDRLVAELGAALERQSFVGSNGRELRGFYVPDKGFLKKPLIWVNAAHHPTVQRHSIAHELGHMLLERKDIHLGRSMNSNRRGKPQAFNIDPMEMRVRQFAAELLMPRHMLTSDLKESPINPEDDEA